MKSLKLAAAISTILLASGCATIVSDSDYSVSIQSTPNANFEILDKNGAILHSGKTPQKVTLAAGAGYFKKASYTINFKHEDKVLKTMPITASIDGWYFGNIIFGGLIGLLIVDPASGAMYSLPESMAADLTQEMASFEKDELKLQVIVIDNLPSQYHKELIALK